MTRLGIVAGLAFEAAIVRKAARVDARMVRVAGASAMRAHAAAVALIDADADALLSFGVAGGLDPALRAGDVVVARTVLGARGRAYPTDAAWRERLVAVLQATGEAVVADVLGGDAPLTTVDAKAAARRDTGAAAIDMESHAVAAVAAEAGKPFLAVRAIADVSARGLPEWSLAAVDAEGRIVVTRVVRGLVAEPGGLGSLPGIARGSRAARRALRRVATLGGPLFGVV